MVLPVDLVAPPQRPANRRRPLPGRWLLRCALQSALRRPPRGRRVHLLLCIADHFEPCVGKPTAAIARDRVRRWVEEYPARLGGFRDSDGRPPRHTFFYPADEYQSDHVDGLAQLCRAGFGEVEVHLHHDHDTADGLRQKLAWFKNVLTERHGLLSRNRYTGATGYAFIHGNWALNNSRPDGRWCGVNNEIEVLRSTGCYADFTLPSAPAPAQTRKINSIYYARGDAARPMGHDTGTDVGRGPAPADGLMMIQGPLLLNASSRKWGVLPRLENGCLQASQPPAPERIDRWLRARVRVPQRPDWYFVKLHTHGAADANRDVLLGEPAARLHRALASRAAADPGFHYHYVTAREMYNLARAAEVAWPGTVDGARDFELVANCHAPNAIVNRPSPV
jgi:hypothetical protein